MPARRRWGRSRRRIGKFSNYTCHTRVPAALSAHPRRYQGCNPATTLRAAMTPSKFARYCGLYETRTFQGSTGPCIPCRRHGARIKFDGYSRGDAESLLIHVFVTDTTKGRFDDRRSQLLIRLSSQIRSTFPSSLSNTTYNIDHSTAGFEIRLPVLSDERPKLGPHCSALAAQARSTTRKHGGLPVRTYSPRNSPPFNSRHPSTSNITDIELSPGVPSDPTAAASMAEDSIAALQAGIAGPAPAAAAVIAALRGTAPPALGAAAATQLGRQKEIPATELKSAMQACRTAACV